MHELALLAVPLVALAYLVAVGAGPTALLALRFPLDAQAALTPIVGAALVASASALVPLGVPPRPLAVGVAVAARHPRRYRREEGVRGQAGHGQNDHHRHVATEEPRREEPEAGGDDQRREEVRQVEAPGEIVDPADVCGPVPEVALEPDRRHGTAEEDLVGAELRPDVRREEAVGVPAQQVVREEHRGERQPLDEEAPKPAPDVGERRREQAEQEPEDERVPRGG